MVAQWKAQQAAKRPKTARLVSNPRLREYVQERLSGSVRRPDGTVVTGPEPPAWKGLNKPHRADRRWATAWSPEQIAHRLRIEFPDDESMVAGCWSNNANRVRCFPVRRHAGA